jgi:hypothetical protein
LHNLCRASNATPKEKLLNTSHSYSFRIVASKQCIPEGEFTTLFLQEFGEGFVFRDIDSISEGSQWEMRIEEALKNCKVVIAHVDDDSEKEIKNRINSTDVLREELNTDLLQKGKTIHTNLHFSLSNC